MLNPSSFKIGEGLYTSLRGLFFVIVLLSILILTSSAASGKELPGLPHAFDGVVLLDGEPAPIGTTVTAKARGIVCGSISVLYLGKFGSDESGNVGPGIQKLVVQGDISEGETIEFFVDDYRADQTVPFASGEVTTLILTASIYATPTPKPSPTPTPSSSPTPKPSPTPTPSSSPTPKPSPTLTHKPSPTPTGGGQETPKPNLFKVENLTITPDQVDPGQNVTITVDVTNIGTSVMTFPIVLSIDGVTMAPKPVLLAPGAIETVSFSITENVSGVHTIDVNGVVDSFVVTGTPPQPVEFVISDLSISPTVVAPTETVTCQVTVANIGEIKGSYTVALAIDGVQEDEREVTVAGGGTLKVQFTVSRQSLGTYAVQVGDLSGSFSVTTGTGATTGTSGALVGIIIVAVVFLGLAILFFTMWRRGAKPAG